MTHATMNSAQNARFDTAVTVALMVLVVGMVFGVISKFAL